MELLGRNTCPVFVWVSYKSLKLNCVWRDGLRWVGQMNKMHNFNPEQEDQTKKTQNKKRNPEPCHYYSILPQKVWIVYIRFHQSSYLHMNPKPNIQHPLSNLAYSSIIGGTQTNSSKNWTILYLILTTQNLGILDLQNESSQARRSKNKTLNHLLEMWIPCLGCCWCLWTES